jgi:penicillin-binding protein 2
MNKTIQAQLAPGSMFKVIVSLAGLQQGVAQNLTVDCQGGIRLYGHWFGCDQHHGVVDIEKAIPWSCDSFFYVLATKLGIDTIARYAHEVGIGRRTGVDLPDEASGLMPSTEWKLRVLHQKWYPGETPSVGIGQGAVQVTPIQMARAVAGIASGGVLEWPHVVFQNQLSRRMREQIREEFPGTRNATVQESTSTWETITDAMYKTVNGGPFATAHQDRLKGIDFAGKTGTAQVVSESAGANRVSSVLARRANGWFVGITPRRNPDIVVVVLWEHGGWGSGAAPIAAKVIEAFVDKQRQLHHNLVTDEKARLDVGAVWSDTQHPNAFGGKPLPGLAREGVNPALSSVRGGHFWVKIPAEAAAQLP